MLKDEARWLGARLRLLDDQRLFPLLNVGSSTQKFREIDQPWIDELIFRPLRDRGGRIVHMDLKPAVGVDIVGDFNAPATWKDLVELAPRSIVCSNVLEHVAESQRARLGAQMVELVQPGGYLIVSVPRAFPYHPDPIDTMYRPSPEALLTLFPGTRALHDEVVHCGTVLGLLDRNILRLVAKAASMVLARPQSGSTERSNASLLDWLVPWLWRPFEVTCLVLEKPVRVRARPP